MSAENAPLKEQPVVRVPPTARDFLANERTFLAYMRTALAFLGFGFVVARFSLFSRELLIGEHVTVTATPQETHISVGLGVLMALVGVLLAAYGTKRYVDQDTSLRRSELIALSPRAAMFIAAAVIVFGAFIALALFRIR